MRCHHCCRHSIFCVIPPYVLEQIARNGSPKQRAAALRTQSVDTTFRALRVAALAAGLVPGPGIVPRAPETMARRRSIFDAAGRQDLPGTLVRSEGQADTDDPAVNEAYHGLGATFDFFAEVLGRNSIDDEGMPLQATVHFGQDYSNAFWNSVQMVFGDGDGDLFNRFAIALDVIGHELTHGVTEDESKLQYFNQSGALNESMSDVFGSLIKQYVHRQTAQQADWLIGAGLLAAGVQGVALRSMKEPGSAFDDPVLGKDPQPAHMNDFVNTLADNGGVHVNSGIPNHVFYLVATRIGGPAWEKAGRIWYDALRDARVKPNTGFRRFARITHDVAGRLYGVGGLEQDAVRFGWDAVGIDV